MIAKRVRPEWRQKFLPLFTWTARHGCKTVRQETNDVLYRLLKEFDAITGVPVLVNTFFNVKGEPIVETPSDAVYASWPRGIDILVLHDVLIEKNVWPRLLTPVANVYSDLREIVRTEMRG